MDGIREEYHLKGTDIPIVLIGEEIDPKHPDLNHTVIKQFNVFAQKGVVLDGKGNLPYGYDKYVCVGDGHGTHIAGIISANCDNVGIQGIACASKLYAYDLGAYQNKELFHPQGLENSIYPLTQALSDISDKNLSQIINCSFSIEAPYIKYKNISKIANKSATEIVDFITTQSSGFADMLDKKLVELANPDDRDYLMNIQERLNISDDETILAVLGSLLPYSNEWKKLITILKKYQKNDGVMIVTEGNIKFGKSLLLSVIPTIEKNIDKDLWITVVMVEPKGISQVTNEKEYDGIIAKKEYIASLNSCNRLNQEYCISTPSFSVISTMTEKVKIPDRPMLIAQNRTYQMHGGHSMGAPMIAGALALMQEYNQKMHFGYTMKDLVKILKQSADKSFPGYDPTVHGRGVLNIRNALEMMKDHYE